MEGRPGSRMREEGLLGLFLGRVFKLSLIEFPALVLKMKIWLQDIQRDLN